MDIDKKIEKMELHDKTPAQMDKMAESVEDYRHFRSKRRAIRYRLYRLRTEAQGGPSAKEDEEFLAAFETQENFGGWSNFSVTWDVSGDDPMRCVHRDKSQAEEWEALVRAKFPVLNPDGSVTYPDPRVKRAVENEAKAQAKKKRKK